MIRSAITFYLIVAGAINALTYAPNPLPAWLLGPVNVITLSLLIAAVWTAPNTKSAIWRGWLFSLSSFSVGLYWLTISMHVYGLMPLPIAISALLLLSAYLAIYPAIAAWLTYRHKPVHRQNVAAIVLFASAWTIAQWLRGNIFTGFPWLSTGYAQIDSPLAAWGSLLGVYGVGFISALLAGLISLTVIKLNWRDITTKHQSIYPAITCSILLVLSSWGLGFIEWSNPVGKALSVRLIQGGISQDTKFSPEQVIAGIDQHIKLGKGKRADSSPNLIVVPETAVPVFQDQLPPQLWSAWQNLAAQQHSTIMVGAPLIDRNKRRYTNSVIALTQSTPIETITSGTGLQHYDKRHLVPFGEFIPWGFRWFVDLMAIPLGDFDRGTDNQTAFPIEDQFVGPNICYEDIFGEELISAVIPQSGKQGATILANFSNLAWFGDSWALRQHWQMARMRAIELARPIIRATNTGITGAINQNGQPIATLPAMMPASLDVTVQGQTGLTPYARFGNAPILILSLLIILVVSLKRRRPR